jgi:nitrite reductase/ring-hydroxylating ferredoxin subunit
MRTEDNELLTRVGPGTPMGELFRRYWLPVLKSSDLEAGGAPIRLRVLGENFLAFRSTAGDVGIIDHQCAHRRASLFYGRNDPGGMRCVYHGWQFDTTGACVDMPSEPPETQFMERVRLRAAAVTEKYGLVWACVGGIEAPPPFPEFDLDKLDASDLEIQFLFRECNWLQGLEADIDTVHVGFLHMGGFGPENFVKGSENYYRQMHLAPRYEAIETPYGTMYSAFRPHGDDQTYHRIGQLMFPSFTIAAQDPLGTIKLRSWLPVDDEHSMLIVIDGPRPDPMAVDKEGKKLPGLFGDGDFQPDTTDWYGRHRMVQNPSNDHMLSREAQRTTNYSGIMGGRVQDQAVVESMGPIVDRSGEHLGTSDQMIIRTRRRMLRAARELRDNGIAPPGSTDAGVYNSVRAGFVTLPNEVDWLDHLNHLRTQDWAPGEHLEVLRRDSVTQMPPARPVKVTNARS